MNYTRKEKIRSYLINELYKNLTPAKILYSSIEDLTKLRQELRFKRIVKFIFDYMGIRNNKVIFTTKCCMEACGFKNRKSVRDGIIELLDKNILTRSSIRYQYWVNPLIMFNGDRIEFIREYRYER